MIFEKLCIIPEDWIPTDGFRGAHPVCLVLEKVIAIGDHIYEIESHNGKFPTNLYYFWVYVEGHAPLKLVFETRERAAQRLIEIKRALIELYGKRES